MPSSSEFHFKTIFQIRNLLKTHPQAIVQAHTAKSHSQALVAMLGLKNKLPLVVSRRVDFTPKRSFYSRWKYRSSRVTYFACVSNKIREILYEFGIPSEKLITIRSGIPIESKLKKGKDKAVLKELQIPDKAFVFGNVAALVDHKDHRTLLKAIHEIREKNFVCLILGDGPLLPKLEKLAEELEISDKVRFLGFRNDLETFFPIFDAFVFSSKEEGLGTSIIEALQWNLPIVSTNAGGIPELLEPGVDSLVSNVGDLEELSQNMQKLMEDNTLLKQLSENAFESAKSFSDAKTALKTMQLYFALKGNKIEGLQIG